jgi:hypothetical protein
MKTTEGTWTMAALAAGVVVTGLAGSALWVRMRGRRIRREIQEARRSQFEADLLPICPPERCGPGLL